MRSTEVDEADLKLAAPLPNSHRRELYDDSARRRMAETVRASYGARGRGKRGSERQARLGFGHDRGKGEGVSSRLGFPGRHVDVGGLLFKQGSTAISHKGIGLAVVLRAMAGRSDRVLPVEDGRFAITPWPTFLLFF